jgi:ribonuclease HII
LALKAYYKKNQVEVGLDEAGRGCLAGPVVAAAVILPPDYSHPLLDDSKKLSEKKRDELRIIIENDALDFAVGFVDHEKIDEINILNASFLAMHRAADQLKTKFDFLLIDGNRFTPYKEVPHECIVKGDGKYQSIAAASILAKTYRDEFMLKLAKEFPYYHWHKNKGYPTKKHVESILENGTSPYHRKSYHIKAYQLSLDF